MKMNLHIVNRFNHFLIIFMIIIIGVLTSLLNTHDFQKVDSLEYTLGLTANKKDKIETLLLLSEEFSINTPGKVLEFK